jgi:hypothetical protein
VRNAGQSVGTGADRNNTTYWWHSLSPLIYKRSGKMFLKERDVVAILT